MKSVRSGSWFITVPVVLLGLAYVWFGFLPGHKQIVELQEQIKAKHQLLEQSQLQGPALAATQQTLSETQAYVQKWGKLAPNVQNTAALCGTIHQLAADAKLTTTRFDPQPPARHELFTQIPISIQAMGDFAGVHSFLARLEGLPIRIWVDSLSVTQPEKTEKTGGFVLADIKLVVFTNNPEDSDYVNLADRPIN